MLYPKLQFKQLNQPNLINAAHTLNQEGTLALTDEKYTYLDIEDNYIHQLFPLLKDSCPEIEKPDYFGINLIGAHISVIYPEEGILVNKDDLEKNHSFKIKNALTTVLGLKRYYVLTVESPTLIELRKKYGLPDQLRFKDFLVDLHITIAVSAVLGI